RTRYAARDLPAAPGGGLSGLLRDDAAAALDAADRTVDAPLPAPALRQPDRLVGAGHAAVPLQPVVQRRVGDRLRRCGCPVADDPRRRAGALAVRSAGRGQGDVDGAGPAGPDLRPQHGPRLTECAVLDGQVGWLYRRTSAALHAVA